MSKVRPVLRRVLVTALLIFALFLLQESVFSRLKLGNVSPNLLIILVSFAGFTRGRKEGMIVGFCSGLLMDLFFGSWFGMYALIYMYIGFINGAFRKLFFGEDMKLPLLFIGLSDVLYGFIIYFFLFFTRQRTDVLFYLKNIILPEAVYTVVIGVILYVPLLLIYNFLGKTDQRSTKSFV